MTPNLTSEFDAVLSECVHVFQLPVSKILGYQDNDRARAAQEAIVEHCLTLEPTPHAGDIATLLKVTGQMVATIRGRIERKLGAVAG